MGDDSDRAEVGGPSEATGAPAGSAQRALGPDTRALIESIPDGVLVADEAGTIIVVNAYAEAMLGYTRAELIGQPVELLLPEHLRRLHRRHRAAYSADPQQRAMGSGLELFARRKDGRVFPIDVSLNVIATAEGPTTVAILRDITERKAVEDALRASEQRFKSVIEFALDAIVTTDSDQRITMFNSAAEQMFGRPAAEVLGQKLDLLIPARFWKSHRRQVAAFSADGYHGQAAAGREAVCGVRANGEEFPCEVSISAAVTASGPTYNAIIRDVSERKRAEDALRKSEALLSEAQRIGRIGHWEWTAPGEALLCSPEVFRIFGLPPETTTLSLDQIAHVMAPEDQAQLRARDAAIFASRSDLNYEFRIVLPDGTLRWIHQHATVTYDEAGRPVRMLGILQDVTERKQIEVSLLQRTEELRLSNERFTELAENVEDIFWISEPGTRRNLYLSPAFESVAGISEADLDQLPNGYLDLVLPEDWPVMLRKRERENNGYSTDAQYRIRRPDGDVRWLRDRGSPIFDARGAVVRVVGIARDITSQLAAEARLRETESRFRQLAENIQEVFWLFDMADRQLIYISPAYEAVWGRPAEALYADPQLFIACTMPEDLPLVLAAREAEARGEPTDLEYRMLRPDGSMRWIWERSFPIFNEAGAVARIAGVATDITERKAAEQDVRDREALLEQVISLGKNITSITDLDRCLREAYRSIREGLAFDRVGIYLYDVATGLLYGVYGTTRAGEPQNIGDKVLLGVEMETWEVAVASPMGMCLVDDYAATYRPPPGHEMEGVRQHLTLAAWAGDTPAAMIVADNLISGRVMTSAQREALQLFVGYVGLAIANARLHAGLEQRVRDGTAEVQDLYDNAPNGYHALDPAGTFLMINQTELAWLGYARDELVGVRAFADLLAPESRQPFLDGYAQVKRLGTVNGVELELLRKDGSVLPVMLNARAVYGPDGAFIQSRSTLFDATERRKVERELRESRASLQNFLDTASDLIQRLDQHGVYIYVNRAWCETLGYTPAEAYGLSMLDVIAPEYHDHCQMILESLAHTGLSRDFEVVFLTKDGRRIVVEGGVSIHLDANGQLTTNGIFRNVTLRKQAEQALRQSRDELSAANTALEKIARLKDEFLANMSHELRTPLNAILAFSENLLEEFRGPLNEHQRSSVRNIEASGRHLLALINDILDLSKVEAGQLTLNLDKVAISDVCQASLLFVKELASKKALRLALHINDQLAFVEADAKRLKQMLVNLLSNAVKFTPAGGQVSLEVLVDPAAGCTSFAVRDTGIGIAPEDLERLFKPFSQLDSSLTRQHEGTGLGLALVRRLAELHGGSVTVESRLGVGSSFTIALPTGRLGSGGQGGPAAAPECGLGGLQGAGAPAAAGPTVARVLLAEDNEVNIAAIGEYLQAKGYEVLVARNGREAIERAEELGPDLILMDIQMPELDGLEAIRQLRARPRWAATPMIALTALAMPGDEERCLAAGANVYLTKPVSLRALADRIRQLTGAAERAGDGPA